MNAKTSSTSSDTGGGAAIVGGSRGAGPGPRLMTADTLVGNQVVNRQDQPLGDIEDIMLDVTQGRIAYAVLSSGGVLGLGAKLFAVPWGALTLDADRKCFILDASKESLEKAPGFDNDRWPDAADQRWHEQVHQHYGSTPYWS